MLLNLRKGESRRREEGYEVQVLQRGPRGGERWVTVNVGTSTSTGTQLPLAEARQLAGKLAEQMARQPEGRKHVRHAHTGWDAEGLRIVKTVLESEVTGEHDSSGKPCLPEATPAIDGPAGLTPEGLALVIHAAFRKAMHPEPGPDVALIPFAEIDPQLHAAWIASAAAAITALRDEDGK